MRKISACLLFLLPLSARADLILYEFNGTAGEWSILAEVVLDEADVAAGTNLAADFVSWVFTWTNGVDTFDSSSADNFLQVASFFLDGSGLVASATDLCSSPCLVGNLESARFSSSGWAAGIPGNAVSGPGAWSEARAVAVPEPGMLALLCIGLAGMGFGRRRKLIQAD